MKNLLIIITLCVIQTACANQNPQASRDLLSFEQISAEISVQRTVLEADTDLSKVTAHNVAITD